MPPEDMTHRRHIDRLKEDCEAIQKRCDRAERALAAKTALCEGLARKVESLNAELRERRKAWKSIRIDFTGYPRHLLGGQVKPVAILDREPEDV